MARTNVIKEQWDYLIILDACRYDYFEQIYRKYIQGELAKKITAGTSTNEWRDNSFPDYYDDVVYISANPQFTRTSRVYGFVAGEHFHKVYEVWKDGWDKDKGTVLPETLTNAAIDIIRNTRGKRFIIHYLQPHTPYLTLPIESGWHINLNANTRAGLICLTGYEAVPTSKKKLFKNLLKLFRGNNILGNHPDWFLRKLLRMPPKNPMEAAWQKYGRKRLRKAYKANLELVLEQVAVLLERLSGKIVITSDHGELLGENNCYAHPSGSSNPILLEVPWLVVERRSEKVEQTSRKAKSSDVKKTGQAPSDADKQSQQKELADKLRALGYYD